MMGSAENSLSDVPRDVLRDIVSRYGRAVVDDPRRCRALLLDLAGQYRREISVLIAAQEELVADDLEDIPDSVPLSMRVAQLTRRLVDNRALAPHAAQWAVSSWAYALGKQVDELDPSMLAASPMQQGPAANRDHNGLPREEPGTYASRFAAEVSGRQSTAPDSSWQRLGQTPGRIRLADARELRFALTAEDDVLADWVHELRAPELVTELAVSGVCSDAGLRALGQLRKLRALSLGNAGKVTDAGVQALASLRHLEALSVAWASAVTDRGFSSLAAMAMLSSLSISRANLSDGALATWAGLGALEELSLIDCRWLSGTGFAGLAPLQRLVTLELPGGEQISDAGVASIGGLRALHKLDLARCFRVTAAGLPHLASLPQLDYLDLSWNRQIDDRALAIVSGLTSLATLNVSHTAVSGAGLPHLEPLQNLVYLDLSGCDQVTDRGLSVAGRLPNLAYLSLVGCARVSRRAIQELSHPGLYIDH